jgi:hypothetical protein
MLAPRPSSRSLAGALAALLLVVSAAAEAELRVSDLDVFLNDFEVTVHVALLGAIPPSFQEGLQSGIPTHVRYTVELWQFNRLWRDRLITSKVVERHLTYNVVTKEFRVSSVRGEARPAYSTRELRDAQRVLSELRGLKLVPASSLDPAEVVYVRVRAETSLNGDATMLARMTGTAEKTERQSDYRTIQRVQ